MENAQTFEIQDITPGAPLIGAEYGRLGRDEVRELARTKLERYIDAGKDRAVTVIDRVLSEIPRDRYVPAPALRFASVEGGGALTALVGEAPAAIHAHALDQTAQRIGMQIRYLHDLIGGGQPWGLDLASHNLN